MSINKNNIDKNNIDKNNIDKNNIDKNNIDKNNIDKNNIDKKNIDKNNIEFHHYIGVIIYIILFVIIIPYILIKLNKYMLLRLWFVNIDQFAIILSNKISPFHDIFKYIYKITHESFLAKLSYILVDYSVIIGIIIISLIDYIKKKNIYTTLTNTSLILIITYFLPDFFIENTMIHTNKFFNKYFTFNYNIDKWISIINWFNYYYYFYKYRSIYY